jgi:peptidoglycan biosynthesis protein MviN/MurJ (putative lipid II flippase)
MLQTALRHSIALMVPCTVALFVLGHDGLSLLYAHGNFLSHDLTQTLHCLWSYGIGLVPSVFVLLFATYYYAQKAYLFPTLVSIACVLFHILCNSILIFALHLGACSIALSTTLASCLNCLLLAPRSIFTGLFGYSGKVIFCSFLAGTCAYAIPSWGKAPMMLGVFLVSAYMLNIEEVFEILGRKKLTQ